MRVFQSFQRGAGPMLVAAIVALAGGCGQSEETTEAEGLRGRSFLLQSSEGFAPVPGTTVRLSFSEKLASFNAGCNSYSGAYQLSGGVLVVSGFGSTEIGCDAPRHQQDEWLATFMTAGPRLTLQGNDLTLRGSTATLVFLDRVVADPDRPLVGTPWTVDTYIDGGGASTVLGLPKDPSFALGTDGRIQVETTCNTGSGTFVHDGAKLTLKSMQYTANPCEAAQSTADKSLRAVLSDGELSVKIVAARLTLMRGDIGVSARGP